MLAQTMPDFELIIVNDGSTDNSSEIAHSYLDKRIKVIDFLENKGCYPAMNTGMRVAKGEYICVVGADDINMPERLDVQSRFLEENREFGMVGSASRILNSSYPDYRETDYETIKVLFLRICYLCHGTTMIRTSLVKKHDLYYNEKYTYASDFDWLARALSLSPGTNTNEVLYEIRRHARQITTSKSKEQFFFIEQIRIKQLSFFGIDPTEDEKELHRSFIRGVIDHRFEKEMVDRWIDRLLEANQGRRYYSQQKLENFLLAHRYRCVFQTKQL